MRYLIIAVIAYHIIGAIAWLFTEHKPAKTIKQIEAEHRQILREQERLAKAQEREEKARIAAEEKLVKEQEKQAAQLAKHEKRIANLEFRMKQAESDIEFLADRMYQLDAQRDYLILQQAGTIPGSKEHTKYQTKIVSLENQIHTTETRLNKAKYIKASAAKELSA